MDKIIYIRYLPLTQKVMNDFYMPNLANEGYQVEYWDITALFWKNTKEVENYIPSPDKNVLIRFFSSKQTLKKSIKENNTALFISIMSFDWRLIWLFRYFQIYNCKTSVFAYLPMPFPTPSSHVRIQMMIKRLKGIKELYYVFANKILLPLILRVGYVKLYDYCFAAGKSGWRVIGNIKLKNLSKTKFFNINNFDYDRFLTKGLSIEKEPYIVFLDEYLPFHPDGLMLYGHSVDPDRYYSDMNKVFDAIEEFYKMPVVIAAHPKALRYRKTNYYNGRKVFFDSTLDCVAKSSMVLAHNSSSIEFAIMCMKKIVFIDSHELERNLPTISELTKAYSAYFESPLISADCISTDVLDKSFELPNSVAQKYSELKDDYFTSLTPSDININVIKKYLRIIFS